MCEIYLKLIIKTIVRNGTASVTKLGTYFTHFSSVYCWACTGKCLLGLVWKDDSSNTILVFI